MAADVYGGATTIRDMAIQPSAGGRALAVELVGPAGSGKSTLLAQMQRVAPTIQPLLRTRSFEYAPVIARDLVRLLPTVLAGLATAPTFVVRTARMLTRLQILHGVLEQARSDAQGPVVLEHGPVFTLAWLAAFHDAEARGGPIATYLSRTTGRWTRTLDVVIWLDAPASVLAERVRVRSKAHRMKDKEEIAVIDFLNRYRDAYESVLARLRVPEGPTILQLRTDQESPQLMATRVLAALRVRSNAS